MYELFTYDLQKVMKVNDLEPSIYKKVYDILEIRNSNGILLVWMMDLGIGWLDWHETKSKKVIDLSLWQLSDSPSGHILGRGILLF